MIRHPIPIHPDRFPRAFHPYLENSALYNSSCSPEAAVYYIEKGSGYYLKTAPKGKLAQEALMTRFYHNLHLGTEVIRYESYEQDWLLTERIPGEDCTHAMYLSDPKRLCDTTAELLRMLHSLPTDFCPVTDRTQVYLKTAEQNYRRNQFDPSLFSEFIRFSSSDHAWALIQENAPFLKQDTLLHGDYCLPNVMLDNWRFSGFIDLGNSGIGDRHFDVFWGIWTLCFNLKTLSHTDRFLDAYGREAISPELLRTVAAIESFL